MSDRREKVARAIYESVTERFLAPKRGATWDVITDADPVIQTWDGLTADERNDYLAYADAAIAAMDAEPTEAEVTAVARVAMGCPYTPPCPYCMDRSRDGLLAARKARS